MSRVSGVMCLPAVACLALLAGRTDATPDDPPKAPAELQGCWKLVSVEAEGETRDPLGGGEPRWLVKGDKVFYGGEEAITLKTDATTKPRVIDLRFRDGDRTYEGIYTVEKDKLKICVNARSDAKDRPGTFSTKDQSEWRLLTFEREKAAPEKPTEGLRAFAGVQLRGDADDNSVVVDAAIKGSPAEKAGLKKDDVILKIGTTAARDLETAVKTVREAKPGTKLDFVVNRGGKETTVTVTVGVLPARLVAMLE